MRSKELAIILFLLSALLIFYVVGRFRDINSGAVLPQTSKPSAPQNYSGRLVPPPPPAPDASSAQQVQQQVMQLVQQLISSGTANLVSGRTVFLPMHVYTGSGRPLGTKKLTAQTTASQPKIPARRKLTTAQNPPQIPGTGPLPPVTVAHLSALVGHHQQPVTAAQACREVASKCSSDSECCNKRCSGGYCLKELRVTRISFSSQQKSLRQTRR